MSGFALIGLVLGVTAVLAWGYVLWLAADMDMGGMDMPEFRMIPAGLGLMAPVDAPWGLTVEIAHPVPAHRFETSCRPEIRRGGPAGTPVSASSISCSTLVRFGKISKGVNSEPSRVCRYSVIWVRF